jgi:hypothetical protein
MVPTRSLAFLVLVLALLAGPASAQGGETAGLITELKPGRGRVEVRRAGASDWLAATPLLALRPGDAVRATENALAVVVLTGGKGSVKVAAPNASFVVPPPSADSRLQKAQALLAGSLGFLAAGAKEPPQAVLATRAVSRPPVVVSPRNTRVLPDSLAFEWAGSRLSRWTVRVVGPGGVLVERAGVPGTRFDYPAAAPRLEPGTRYSFQVMGPVHPPQDAWFEILDRGAADAVRADLAALQQALGSVPAGTLAAVKAGFLARAGLGHDARLVVARALAADPDEPALHLLLSTLYADAGLPDLAAEAYDEAQFLLRQTSAESPAGKR